MAIAAAAAVPSVRQSQEGQHYQLENGDSKCTFNCNFTWKILNLQQKRCTANRLHALYSSPFNTSGQYGGYKMCLFLYLDGDGSGKGTHLSFFLTLMRGEYDALLPWPFKQKVTLTLMSQDAEREKHIQQRIIPDPARCDSFQRPSPYSEMNVAFGCPQFAPLSVLDNPAYVKGDAIILKCVVETDNDGNNN